MSNVFTTISTEIMKVDCGDEIFTALFSLNKKINVNGEIENIETPNREVITQEKLNHLIDKAIEKKIILKEGDKLRVAPKYMMIGFKEPNSDIFSIRNIESLGGHYEYI